VGHILNVEKVPQGDLIEAVKELTGGLGAGLVIEVTGFAPVVETGVEVLRVGGRYFLQGAVYPNDSFTLQSRNIITKCLTLLGLHNYELRHLGMALNLAY
jgi:threonine dehydrogenase-like Zn-dependent dehydrogenase